jgi:amino acid adenylation domain-containing protein
MRENSHITRFDMEVYVRDTENGITLQFVCRDDLYESQTVERMLDHYAVIIEGAVSDLSCPVIDLPMMSSHELDQILREWNRTEKDFPLEKTLDQLIQQQVYRSPDSVAVQFEDQALSYRELDARANQLANYLSENGVGPETLVAVCMERSVEMVIALYGVLKSGAAYVPLDPEHPTERLAFVIDETRTPVILSQQHLRDRIPDAESKIFCLDSEWDAIKERDSSRLPATATPDNLAYVIYTSGSTGKPKGVMNTHKGIVNRLCWMQQAFQLDADDMVLQKTPFSFDVSVWEFFWPIMTGACVVLAKPGGHRDTAYLAGLIIDRAITTLHFVPSMLKIFLEHESLKAAGSLKRVICSGEALTRELQEQFFDVCDAELHNLYGPTEAAVDVTSWHCRHTYPANSVPIGRPIANTRVYILDSGLNPVPAGVPGELHIGGVQVARGYVNRPDLTAEKFIVDPFSQKADARLYKTGDLARYLPDGNIEYLGRMDFQVKLRGFRIELGEIESVLRKHDAVSDAVVLCRQYSAAEPRLVAYVVGTKNNMACVEELRTAVRAALPDYMMPAAFVFLDRIPLTSSGKVDRRELPEAKDERQAAQALVQPRNTLERQLVDIWRQVLNVDQIGIHDNFFDLGGHSLLATQVVSRTRETLGAELPVTILFEHPTVEGLADRIEVSRWKDDHDQQDEMEDWEEFSL